MLRVCTHSLSNQMKEVGLSAFFKQPGVVLYLSSEGRLLPVYRSKPILTFHFRDVFASLGYRRSFLFLLAALVVSMTPRAAAQHVPTPSSRPDLPFVFSDFDGDHRPDLAFVQSGRSDSSSTDYWVQLQLSSEGSQAIRVVGPTGGLQIAARDVNGDQVPDLVLTSAWRDQPVAILLNDGHGNFSPLDPSANSQAFSASSTCWTSSASPDQDLLVAPLQSRSSGHPAAVRLPVLDSSLHVARRSDCGFFLNRYLASHPGRAPPSVSRLL